MGHYAKVEDGLVTQVIVANGPDWCEENLGGEWIQTSYNTHGGVHSGGKFAIHKNYAGVGYTFDGIGFAAPKPYNSWTLNQETYLWESPVPKPEEGFWQWNEEDQAWDSLEPID
jgi:hypothetical protein